MKPVKHEHLKALAAKTSTDATSSAWAEARLRDDHLSVQNAVMHSIIRLDENGFITAWNIGAERMTGYTRDDVIGLHVSIIFTEEDLAAQQHVAEMELALKAGYAEDERWHVRKDKSLFWASGMTTPVYDEHRNFIGFLKIARDRTTEKLKNERLTFVTQHDPLTGLPNRRMFHNELHKTIQHATVTKMHFEVLFIDLDRFKEINDAYGHHIGDLFLKEVATRLRKAVRDTDLVARLSGDEFGVIYKGIHRKTDAVPFAEKLVQELSRPYVVDSNDIRSGASIGVTSYPSDSEDPVQILKNADLAMYAAKSSGRSTYRLYSVDLDQDAKRRRLVHEELQKALSTNGLELHYQPQYSLDGHRLHVVEGLLRWQNCPIPNMTSHELFAVANETGLIISIGEWTLRTACEQAQRWVEQGVGDFRIAVNIAARHLRDPGFLRLVDHILADTGLAARYLELEITEFALMEHNQANAKVLQSLKKRGIHLSVDDFGTGFSSLGSLKSFPVDTLKIDQTFVSRLPQSAHDTAIASAIIGLAHSLELDVVAECIESHEQQECLAMLGCDFGQGNLFAPPRPASQLWQ